MAKQRFAIVSNILLTIAKFSITLFLDQDDSKSTTHGKLSAVRHITTTFL